MCWKVDRDDLHMMTYIKARWKENDWLLMWRGKVEVAWKRMASDGKKWAKNGPSSFLYDSDCTLTVLYDCNIHCSQDALGWAAWARLGSAQLAVTGRSTVHR